MRLLAAAVTIAALSIVPQDNCADELQRLRQVEALRIQQVAEYEATIAALRTELRMERAQRDVWRESAELYLDERDGARRGRSIASTIAAILGGIILGDRVF